MHKAKWKSLTLFLSLFSFLLLFSVQQNVQASTLGDLVTIAVPSPESDFPMRKALVWTPPSNFGNANNLPVVYFLHGWPGTPDSIARSFISPLYKSFTSGAKPFIAVFPDGNAITHNDSEWADSSDGAAMVETWIIKKLIPAVEYKRLRKNSERAIAGFSMGGYGASIIALHHPEIFSQVASFSGYFQVDDLTGTFTDVAKNKSQDPHTYLNTANKINWYLTEGNQEVDVLIHGQAAKWASQLKKVQANYRIRYLNGGHYYSVVVSTIPDFVKWLKWNSKGQIYPYKVDQASIASADTQTSGSN
jgi:S-formylglutathione hydrolase FrmB